MKKVVFLVALFVSMVGFSQEDPIQVPQIAVKVSMGETVTFKNASVTFIKVLEDSRCPENTTCIWEGQVKILASVEEFGQEAEEVEVLFGKEIKNTLLSSEGYILKCLSVTPYPNAEDNGKRDYSILVSEEKK